MNASRWCLLVATLGAALAASSAAQVIIRGNGAVDVKIVSGSSSAVETKASPVDPAWSQWLVFNGGERLRGTLEALDMAQGRITWRRPDAAGSLVIPLAEIRSLGSESPALAGAAKLATIKFTGGDWLVTEVTAIQGEKIQLQLRDGTRLATDRAHVEWIYFSKSGAVACYDGPTNFAGWSSAGGWTYRDGALRVKGTVPVGRMFAALPDQVEYQMTVDQGELVNAFNLALHGRSTARGLTRGMVQIVVRASSLQLWASIDGNYKTVQTDLTPLLGAPGGRAKGPLHLRVLEDFTGGRVLVYLNERKAADWKIDKGEPGKNGGGFQFMPTSSSGQKEQSLANIKVLPWDGREPTAEKSTTDRAVLVGGELKTGSVMSWNGRTLKLGTATISRDKLSLLRFRRPENPPDDAAPIAQVRLQGGGEFEATKLGWRDGKWLIQTNFAGEMALAPAAVAALDFPRGETKSLAANDVLVFRNGDRLRGSLGPAEESVRLNWRVEEAGVPVIFSPANIASVLFAPRPSGPPGRMVARFRNGDWLGGTLLALDGENLGFDNAPAGQLRVPRTLVKALYFAPAASPEVSDGASDHELWERGLNGSANAAGGAGQNPSETASPWIYGAGTFKVAPFGRDEASSRGSGVQLGRMFETLAPRVEMSFTVSGDQNPVFFTAQLFSEPGNLLSRLTKETGKRGYLMHVSTVGLSIYDMNPRPNGRGIVQQQFPFGEALERDARERRLQIFADRTTGRMTVLVDGVVTARFAPKTTEGPRELGRGVMLSPQTSIGCTFSNFWIGPWNGRLPGPDSGGKGATVALANGDEVEGTVEGSTATTLTVASEVGALELPIERVTMVDFGGAPVERGPGARLHLVGQGALTVTSWRIEHESLICQSEIAGELTLPLAAVQEIVFAARPAKAAAR